MSTPKKKNPPPEKLELYEKLVATIPDVARKGASVPYTSLNGNMFSYLHASGAMALRLPEAERKKFLTKYKTTLFEAYGVVQKEYVTVPDSLLANTKELKRYFELSVEYAKSLKPKPTKKAK
jgi:TfoX/Sxy family transcriptional regulator of competence genes